VSSLSKRWLVACCACAPTLPANAPNVTPHDPLDEAHVYELGRGVPRDYRAAARIYRERCRNGNGNGDPTACRAPFQVAIRNRGIILPYETQRW
jgi:hypothetical protein